MSVISELIKELIDNADLYTKELHDLMYRAAETIEALSEKVREPKQGEWIYHRPPDDWIMSLYSCSECGHTEEGKPNFCPNCGARMKTKGHVCSSSQINIMNDLISRESLISKARHEAEGMPEPWHSELEVIVAWLAEKIPSDMNYSCDGCKYNNPLGLSVCKDCARTLFDKYTPYRGLRRKCIDCEW